MKLTFLTLCMLFLTAKATLIIFPSFGSYSETYEMIDCSDSISVLKDYVTKLHRYSTGVDTFLHKKDSLLVYKDSVIVENMIEKWFLRGQIDSLSDELLINNAVAREQINLYKTQYKLCLEELTSLSRKIPPNNKVFYITSDGYVCINFKNMFKGKDP